MATVNPLRLPDPYELAVDLWNGMRPFPHVVLDDLFDDNLVMDAAAEFPLPDDPRWHTFTGPLEANKQEGDYRIAGPAVAELHRQLGSQWFVDWLRALTGERWLTSDPFRTGGGIHQSGPGARLGMHVDFDLHPQNHSLIRCVNVMLFLGLFWDDTDGGVLQLGIGDDARVVPPDTNRLVVFEASATNWHGHPKPIADDYTGPTRKTIPAYFYRPVRDGDPTEPHSTRFYDG